MTLKRISISQHFMQKTVGKRFIDVLGHTGWTDAGLVQYFYWDETSKKSILKFKTYISLDKYDELVKKWSLQQEA